MGSCKITLRDMMYGKSVSNLKAVWEICVLSWKQVLFSDPGWSLLQ